MDNVLVISQAPHLKDRLGTRQIMLEVVLALVPAAAAGVYFFGARAIFIILACVFSCTTTEIIFQYLRGVKIAVSDFSAVVTGLLLALILPPSIPLWAAVLGGVVSIALAKQLFGGLGCNIFNPALIGRAFLAACYPSMMTKWIEPFTLDAVTSATPLGLMKFYNTSTDIGKLFIGNISGSLGETSALALLIGGVYLLLRGHAKRRTTFAYLITVFIFSFIAWLIKPNLGSPLFHLFSGGLMIGAFFMVTDPVTTPVTRNGRIIFGFGAGMLVMVIRIFGGLPEGVMYSILLMNSLTPLINRYTIPTPFGGSIWKKKSI